MLKGEPKLFSLYRNTWSGVEGLYCRIPHKPALEGVGMTFLTWENDVAPCSGALRGVWGDTTLSVGGAHVYPSPLLRRDESFLLSWGSSKERSDAGGIKSLLSCCSSCPIQNQFLFVKGSVHLIGDPPAPLLMWSLSPGVGCSNF